MRNIAYERTEQCFVVVRGREAPSEKEFDWYLATIERALREGMPPRCLVLTEGSSPSPTQWTELAARLAIVQSAVRVAVLGGALDAGNADDAGDQGSAPPADRRGYRVFAADEVDEAIAYLGVWPGAAAQIRSTLARLQAELHADDGPA